MNEDDPDRAEEEFGTGDAKRWLAMLDEAEKADEAYHAQADRVDRLYADAERLRSETRVDREFQMFWANVDIVEEATYAREPVPVVSPRFRDRKELPRKASEILERALQADFEMDDLHETLKLVRSDMVINARGVPWLRLGMREGIRAAICEHVDRCDFRHGAARKWAEVPWVARRSWLTREEGLERFGDAWRGVDVQERDIGNPEDEKGGEPKGEVWELWHRAEDVVVWVSPNVEHILDAQEPWLSVKGFFPCPRPAYATLKRRTLRPIPDVVFYQDQLEEINELTARMAAICDGLRLKGFYASGSTDIADAVENAIRATDNRAILIPITTTSLVDAKMAEVVMWLPVDQVAATLRELITQRRQLIEDVYEITGLSDIMRGATQASETATAQRIKAQFGSIRIAKKQAEMARVARDVIRLKAEIMAEHLDMETLLQMSQVDDLPRQQEIEAQKMQLAQQVQAAASNPRMIAMAQQNPQQAQKVIAQVQQQMQKLDQVVTVEKVAELFGSERARPFVLDIETDSTIRPDEDAEKQRRVELMGAMGQFLPVAGQMVMTAPASAPFVAETLKFIVGGFRPGRAMDDAIDEFAEQIRQGLMKPQGPKPEEQAAMAEAKAKIEESAAKTEKTRAEAEAIRRPKPEPVSVDPLDWERLALDQRAQATDEFRAMNERKEPADG